MILEETRGGCELHDTVRINNRVVSTKEHIERAEDECVTWAECVSGHVNRARSAKVDCANAGSE